LKSYGFKIHLSEGVERTIIGAIGDERTLGDKPLASFEGVEKVVPILKPYKIVSRDFRRDDALIQVGSAKFWCWLFICNCWPCSVESEEMIFTVAERLKKLGVKVLRGGAFKPRTSPYAFQGLGLEGLKYLRKAADTYGLIVVTELMDPRDIDIFLEYADIIRLGKEYANFRLLSEIGKIKNLLF